MLGQVFILTSRGDSILTKDFRGDAPPGMYENFFRKVKFWDKGDAPPVFLLDGITFIYIKRNSLIIACTTRYNVAPSTTIELLNRIAKIFKDYCGILNEDNIRKNFILLYELLDEMLDFGYPQITSTESLKVYVHNEPAPVQVPLGRAASNSIISTLAPRTMPSAASHKPISLPNQNSSSSSSLGTRLNKSQKNEIFVDIIERITVLFNSDGTIINSSIDGSIQLKSYLAGNPELKLALNENLIIGRTANNNNNNNNSDLTSSGYRYGATVILDDCNFHECVRLDEFESSRTLVFLPPDGEFSVLNYRITNTEFLIPFMIQPTIEEFSNNLYRLDLLINLRANIPESNHATNVLIVIPVPRSTSSCTFECSLPSSSTSIEYNPHEKRILWAIKKLYGGNEINLRMKLTLDSPVNMIHKRELGPISMNFDIPMYNLSNLQVRYLRIAEISKAYNPYRWVRYITQSSSYVCRLKL